MPRGIVAAGHPVTAAAGAEVLREGGNAVDAALAAVLHSFTAEPLLTGLGAGGYLLVAGPGREPVLLDFFVAAPGRPPQAPLVEVAVSFGEASQIFHVGAASCGVWGTPAGICAAAERYGTVPLPDLCAPAAALAREGLAINAQQAYLLDILSPIVRSSPEARAHFEPRGRLGAVGDRYRDPALADALERLGGEGAAPFYGGDVGQALCAWVAERGGALAPEDLRAYSAVERRPVRVAFGGREVLTNPPPSAGGILIAYALALIERGAGLLEAMEAAQAERTADFLQGLGEEDFGDAFLSSRLGSTTHIAALDADGLACSVTCTNGEGSGVLVPGTGVHLNNMMGEEDLSPHGYFTHPPGSRMPSMMAPTIVLGPEGVPELALGSAGSNRIRSAIVQVVVHVVGDGMDLRAAVDAPRLHFEAGCVYTEPGVDERSLAGREVVRFRERNLFFGGVQAVRRDTASGGLAGAADPRRGGAVAVAR